MASDTLSARLHIHGAPFAPQRALGPLLSGIVGALDAPMLGHIKGVARFPDGSLFASTVGTPPDVTFRVFGRVPDAVTDLEFQLTCIVFGATGDRLRQAVDATIATLSDEFHIEGEFHDRNHQH